MSRRRLFGPDHPVASAVFGAAMIAMVTYLFVSRPGPIPAVPHPPAKAQPDPPAPVARQVVQRANFYDQEVEPLIAKTDALNREAATAFNHLSRI